ncbi:hypothetical protein ABTY98_18070 [Streptomyces sp. NPDC096040]|uniref:hypothetical protein n=1 Tax=Streptomyces sp. NPDC096040 TaxID=3155541 RepID=UPI0033278CD4
MSTSVVRERQGATAGAIQVPRSGFAFTQTGLTITDSIWDCNGGANQQWTALPVS